MNMRSYYTQDQEKKHRNGSLSSTRDRNPRIEDCGTRMTFQSAPRARRELPWTPRGCRMVIRCVYQPLAAHFACNSKIWASNSDRVRLRNQLLIVRVSVHSNGNAFSIRSLRTKLEADWSVFGDLKHRLHSIDVESFRIQFMSVRAAVNVEARDFRNWKFEDGSGN